MEAIELAEEPGGGVGDGPHGIFGMDGHPLLEVAVGTVEVEVIEIVVTVVERATAEWGGLCREGWNAEQEGG